MERLSRKLTDYILAKDVIEESEFEIYQYGFQSFLELAINIICSIIIAVLLGMKLECIAFFLFFIPLRAYSGGFHMEHYISCLLLSCLSLAGILCIVKYFSATPLFSCILYLISLAIIKVIGSVDHPNRYVDEEDNLFFNKRANIILLMSLTIFVVFLLSNNTRYLLLEALVFTLMSISLIIGKIQYS
ncbi:MAG: accessory gene regulator B family protein [Lachnospiraceae bacterium]|nr:accessory gene regulator B family protein [Lachnospiraceae bacterium]